MMKHARELARLFFNLVYSIHKQKILLTKGYLNMKIISAGFKIENPEIFEKMLHRIEVIGRTCYKSEEKINADSSEQFVKTIIDRGHEAMLEHGGLISVRFIVDRGISHELVRHRIASFAQESTRYCNYTKDKFGNELTFIKPCWLKRDTGRDEWKNAMSNAEKSYLNLVSNLNWSAQEARTVLPNSIKTEIIMSANPREWRAFFKLRTPDSAHPQMREVTVPLLNEFKSNVAVLFDDIVY